MRLTKGQIKLNRIVSIVKAGGGLLLLESLLKGQSKAVADSMSLL